MSYIFASTSFLCQSRWRGVNLVTLVFASVGLNGLFCEYTLTFTNYNQYDIYEIVISSSLMPENAFYLLLLYGLFIKVTLVLPDCVVFD